MRPLGIVIINVSLWFFTPFGFSSTFASIKVFVYCGTRTYVHLEELTRFVEKLDLASRPSGKSFAGFTSIYLEAISRNACAK